MVYSPHPPYEVLSTSVIDFTSMQRMRRFARYWDLVGNSGNFIATRDLIWHDGSPFNHFMQFCDWLYEREQKLHGISLTRLSERVFEFLLEHGQPEDVVATSIWSDYVGDGRYDKPHFLRRFELSEPPRRSAVKTGPPRQARHLP